MKKTIKRIFASLMVAVMVLTAAPMSGFVGLDLPNLFDVFASAASYNGTCGDNLTWLLDTESGELVISGTGEMKDYSTKYSNGSYITDAPWSSYVSSIRSVTIQNGATSIGKYAFYNCTSLTSITIPDSVASIGSSAFSGCTSLTSITIPDSVTSMGYGVFGSCTNLTSITIPDSVTSIGSSVFYNCPSLTSITIPDSVTSIGLSAFDGCTGLTSITIPDSVTRIGEYAFDGCTGLTSITIPDSVKSIGECAFRDCTSLTSITIPDSVKSIGYFAFRNTGYYNDSSNWEDDVLYIGNHLIEANTSISGAYTIKEGTMSIGSYAFDDCPSLTSITIPDSVTSIAYRAFNYCNILTDVYYTGTEEEWNKIYNGGYNDDLLNANIHFLNGMIISSSGVKTYSNDVVITPYGEKTFILNNDEFVDSKDYKRLTQATLKINSASKNNSSKNPEFVISASEAQNNGVRLTSSGYRDYIIPEIVMNSWSTQVNLGSKNSAPGYVHNAYMQLDRKDGKPYISTVFGRKASVGEYVELKTSELKVKKDTKYDIVISLGGIDDSESYTYYLSQNENNKIQNSTGVFDARTLTDIFKDGKAIYAYAKSESGVTTELQQVNIIIEEEITSTLDFINSSTFNLLGPDFAKITIPSSVPLIGEAEISFEAFKMPAGFEYDGESLKVSIGANIFNANTELKKNSPTKYKKWSTECFNDWKSMTKTTSEAISKTEKGHKEAKDSYSKAKENFSNKWGNIASKNKKKNWDLDVLGYIDAAIVNGELVVKEAFISVEGSFTFKYTVQGAIWVIPAYCYVEAGGSLGAEAVGSRVIIDSEVPFEWDLTIKLEPEVTIGGGVGVDDVLSAGIYANATLPIRLDVTNDHLTIQLTGEIGVEAEAWVLKAKKKLLSGTLDVVDTYYGKQTRFVTQSNPITGEEETYVITYEVVNRDYVENMSQWLGDDISFDTMALSQGGMTLETLQSSVFDSAKPQVVSFGDKMLMTWIEDDTSRDTYNRMRLMYSVYDGVTWSEPKAVYDNGCNDNEPVIVTDGEDVYFAWQKLSKKLTEDDVMSVNAVVENCEIYIAKYDSSEDAITGAKRVADNSVYDYAHNVSVINGIPYVYWVTCNDNNMESSSNNTLKKASFDGTTSVVKSNLNYILDLDAAYINGKENVSYSMDADGNTLTANDINVFTLVDGVSKSFDKHSDVAYTTAFYGELNGETVLFVSDMSNIYYVEEEEVKAVLDRDRTTLGNINYVDNNGEGIFVWTENNGIGNDVYSSTFENGSWTTPIVVSNEESALLTSIDTTMYKGQFHGVCMSTDLVLNEETQVYEIGQTDLCSFTIAEMQDISVDSIMIDERDIEIGKETSFDVYITNNGSETIKNATFTVSDGLGFIQTFTKEINLGSGDYTAVTLTYTAPENYSATELSVTVSCAEITDENSDNDVTSVEIGTPKIVLNESNMYVLGSDYVITALVTNESDVLVENIKVIASFDSDFSDAYADFTIDSLGARETSIIEFVVPKENVEFDESGIAKVYLTAELGDKRSNNVCMLLESNNTECEHPVTEEIVVDSDCCEVGKRTVICSGCVETLSETEIPKKSHDYKDGICTECGAEYICSHTVVEEVVVEPTCTKTGYITKVCDECGETVSYVELSKVEHQYVDGFCVDCGLKYVCEHQNTVMEVMQETCYYSGYISVYCRDCGLQISFTELPQKEHNYVDGICTDCLMEYICSHTVVEEVVVEPTCTKPGYITEVCDECGETVTSIELPMVEHQYIDGICTECGESAVVISTRPGSTTRIDYVNKIICNIDIGIDYDCLFSNFISISNNVKHDCGSGVVATGNTISFFDIKTNEIVDRYTIVIFGDVNSDGLCDGQDAIIVDCLANGMLTKEDVGEAIYMAADCNRDGTINSADVELLQKAGLKQIDISQTGKTTNTSDFLYEDCDEGIVITGLVSDDFTTVVIPSQIEGKDVVRIDESAFSLHFSIKNVIIPDSVTYIGNNAFWYCPNLAEMKLSQNIEYIGYGAFASCAGLNRITVDTRNAVYSSDEYGVLFNKDKTQIIQYPAGNTNANYSIPNTVFSIGDSAFGYCKYLESITISKNVKDIGIFAFRSCEGLTSITIPESVTNIGLHAFEYCYNLEEIIVSESNTIYSSDEYGVLFNKDKTQLIIYPQGNTQSEYIIPDSVKRIEYGAFDDRDYLDNITIGSGIEYIENHAFYGCSGLKTIYYKGTPVKWNKIYVGYENDSLWDAEIIFLGEEKTVVNSGECGESLAWTLYSDGEIVISGTGPMTNYSSTSPAPWSAYIKDVKKLTVKNGVTTIGNDTFIGCTNLEEVLLPDGITKIGDSAFRDCTSITEITIPDTVKFLGHYAFYGCIGITEIEIGSAVKTLGNHSFRMCTNLKSVTIPVSVTTINNNAFNECTALKTVVYQGTADQWTTVTVGTGNDLLLSKITYLNS